MDPLPGLVSAYPLSNMWEGLLVQTGASQLEARQQQQSFPRYGRELVFDYLNLTTRGVYTDAIAGQNLQYLIGMQNQLGGGLLSFFYRDQEFNTVSNGLIATGDGTTLSFQLQADIGGAFIPVYGVDTRGAIQYGPYNQPASKTQQVYLNYPTPATPGTWAMDSETGILAFTAGNAPGGGVVVSADFSYLFRVRLEDNKLDFQRRWNLVYGLESMKIIQVLAP